MTSSPVLPARLADLAPRWARLCLRVAGFLKDQAGFDLDGASLAVAVSGGPDSTALLLILSCLRSRHGLTLHPLCLDHALRPESADEARRVGELCRALGLSCRIERRDVAALAREAGCGLEEAGRTARYDFFARARAETGAEATALGHQLDDLAEDALLRLTRGAGWPALGGMTAFDRQRGVLRPLLLTPRRILRNFVADLGLTVFDDPSNADPTFRRNRLRGTVLPLLLAENPAFLSAVARLWRQARADAAHFDSALAPAMAAVIVSADQTFLPRAALGGLDEALRVRLYKRLLDDLGPGESRADTLVALDRSVMEKRPGDFAFPGRKWAVSSRAGVAFQLEKGHIAASRGRGNPLTGLATNAKKGDCEIFYKEAVPVNILIFGPNGSGKGTQGSLVKKKYNLAHIESGGIFREHIGGGTELGKKAKEFIDRGELVPDDITIPMVLATLKDKGKDGWLLDGFPRNMVQAEKLYEALKSENMKLDYVIEILLPRQIAKDRIMGRRICDKDPNHPNNIFIDAIKPNGDICRVCGGGLKARSDDQDETAINKRHDIYYDTKTGTLAAAYFYKDLAAKGLTTYIELNGEGSIDSIKDTLLAKLA